MHKRGGVLHMTCFKWCVNMTWHVYGLGSADNVKTTCNWRDQDEHVRARARSRVYKSGNLRQNIRGARGDQGTADWVPCSSGVRKELKLTCMLGATWATSSGLCQELFQAALDDPDTFGTSISCYRTCMKCWYGYLVCWGFAGRILEGLKGEVKISSQMANMEQGKWF